MFVEGPTSKLLADHFQSLVLGNYPMSTADCGKTFFKWIMFTQEETLLLNAEDVINQLLTSGVPGL